MHENQIDDWSEQELPKYKCHKEVHALEISAVRIDADGNRFLVPKDKDYSEISIRNTWYSKHAWQSGQPVDLKKGYYVVYADGYTSWSPTRVFEEGYTSI